jgi:hypothetical protein
MGKHRWLKIECFHTGGDPESQRLKGAALNLFHPTASSLFRKTAFSYCDTVSGRQGQGGMEDEMRCRNGFLIAIVLFFSLVCMGFAEDYTLQYFLSKASSKAVDLSKKEKTELLNQLDEVMKQGQEIRTKLVQALQIGEADVRYQEGKFWMTKLEEDQGSIESGFQQIKLLRERPTDLIATIKLYKSLKGLSSNFNTYNNLPSFSALVGDFAPEVELWADPVFYELCLLSLARLKDRETKAPHTEKKPVSRDQKPASKEKRP